jgi:hypothetical protein
MSGSIAISNLVGFGDYGTMAEGPISTGRTTMSDAGSSLTIRKQGVEFNIEFIESEPRWLRPMALKLAEMLALEPNWDSYGAAAVSRESVVAALEDVLPLVMERWYVSSGSCADTSRRYSVRMAYVWP